MTLGLASKANQSALDALQVQVDGKSTPASVDLKLSNHPTTAAMNSSIASANNATLASVATTYALKSVVDQLALDVAARQTAGDVAQAIATALLPLVSTSDLTAAVNLRTTPADVSQLIATALLPFVQQAAVDAALALRDSRLDGHDTDILALQNAGPFATAGDLNTLQLTLQSAIDGILAEISTLGGATNLVNAPAWLGNVTWDLLAGTNQIRNLHATGPLSIQLANDDWTLSFGCDAYTTQQTDDAIAGALTNYFTRAEVTVTVVAAIDESKAYTDTQLTDYSTTTQMTQAITDALLPFETAVQRDAAISLALQAYYTSAQTDAAIAAGLATIDLTPYYTSAQTDAAIAAAVALSNGQSWTGGPTFNLLRGSNVLRNLSVAGALTASFQNLDDTILIESDSYARSETYTQLETGAAITAAIDALNLSQYRTEAQVLALIAGELVPYWDQTEVSTYVAGELSNYATSSSVTSAISSALSSYDNSSQVDSKIVTALLDFYTRAEVDQQITNALGNVDLSNYYTQAETQSYVAGELLAFYPRTELDSQLTATFTQYWTSGRTQTEIDDAIAGAGFLTQALADQRYFAVSANASFESLVRTNVTPPMIKALLPRAPLAANTILSDTTLELTCDAYTKAEADGRYLRAAGRQVLRSEPVGGRGQRPLPPRPGAVHAELHPQPALPAAPDRGLSWATAASSRSRRTAGARPRATAATRWWPRSTRSAARSRPSTAGSHLLHDSSFLETRELRGTPIVLRAIDNTPLASFAAAGITLDQDVTVNAARTLNATTADFAQLLAGSVAASGNVTTNGSILADQQIESDLRLRAPVLESDPAGFFLTLTGGTQGVLVDDTFRVNGAIAPEASLPFLSLSGGTSGVQVLSPLLEQIAVGPPGGSVGTVIRNVAPTGESTVLLDSNNQAGLAELKVLSIGGCQLNALNQTIALNTSSGPANLLIEANTGGGSDGEVICFYGFQNLSDESLKTNLRPVLAEEAQQCFDGVEATFYDRLDGPANQVGFVAQQVEALGKSLCKLKKFEDRELMTLDYQRMTAVLWQVCKSLQRRLEKLEKKKRGRS